MGAITRSKSLTTKSVATSPTKVTTITKTTIVDSNSKLLQSSTGNAKINKKPKLTKPKPKLSKSSLDLEDLLTHITIPQDLSLPPKYIEDHTPEFIKGIYHILKIDPSLYPVIVHQNFRSFSSLTYTNVTMNENYNNTNIDKDNPIHNYWYSLIRSVIAQQVSGAAAKAIQTRFEGLFNGIPTPDKTLKFSAEELKNVGLSNMKVKYVQSISEAFNDPNNHLTQLEFYKQSNLDDILTELCKLKGIGIWSAKMFAMFTLEEMDVFAEDDLGIARGMARYLNKRPELLKQIKQECLNDEESQLLLKRKLKFANKTDSKRNWTPIHDAYVKYAAKKFLPYRSVFMMILWRLSSTNIDVLEKLDE